MAAGDLNFNVGVDTAGAIRSINSLNNALGNLTNAFSITLAGISVGAIVKFSDSITSLKNRLNLVTDTAEETNVAFRALTAIAIESRTDLAATGDLFFRIARNAKELGISQREAAQITESLAKAMSASGLSAGESAGPLLQLGQALQSGVFQGDELRSILEGLPPVAKALADQLGVPIGALRKMGADGQITAQDFVLAMRKARDAIERDFAESVPTIAQAFGQVKSAAALAFSEFESNTKAGKDLAAAIEFVAMKLTQLSERMNEYADTIKKVLEIGLLIAAFTIFGRVILFVVNTVTSLYRVFVGIGGAIGTMSKGIAEFGTKFLGVAAPLQSIVQKVAQAVLSLAALLGLSDVVKGFYDGVSSVKNFIGDMFDAGDSTTAAGKELEDYRKGLGKFKNDLSTAAGAPAPVFLDPEKMRKARQEMEQIVISYQRANDAQIKRLELDQSLIGLTEQQKAVRQALADLENNYIQEVSKLVDEYRKKSESKNKEDQAQLPLIQKAIEGVSAAYADQIDKVKELTNSNFLLAEAEKQRLAFAEYSINTQIDTSKNLQKLQDDMAKLTMSEIEKKYYDIDIAARESARSAIDAENSRRRSLKIAAMTTEEEQRYYEEAKRGTDELKQKTAELYNQGRQFSTGWKNAFQSYIDDATNAAKVAERIFQKTTSAMEDMIVNFAKTGKFEFKNFMNSILEELLRSQVRQMIAQIFQIGNVGASGGSGGLMGSIGNLLGFANGGIIPTNRPVLVGERGPELISGASGRVVTPNEQLGMGPSFVTYNISAVDARSFKDLVAQDPSFIYAVSQQGSKGIPGRR